MCQDRATANFTFVFSDSISWCNGACKFYESYRSSMLGVDPQESSYSMFSLDMANNCVNLMPAAGLDHVHWNGATKKFHFPLEKCTILEFSFSGTRSAEHLLKST